MAKRIGLTIEQSGVRYASIRKKKGWAIDRTGFLPLPEGLIVDDQILNEESLRLALKDWIKKEKLKGSSVTLAVPTSQIIVRKMRIPTTNAKELRHLIELEVETTLHLPFEEPVYDYVKISEDDESTQVLIFAAPRKWIDTASDMLHEAGLQVKGAEIAAAAMAKSIFAQQFEPISETMIVNITDTALEVYLFHEGTPLFMRAINLSENMEHEAGKLNEYQLAELTAELSRMLNFYQFGLHEGASRITKAVIAGPAPAKFGLITALRDSQPEISIREANFEAFEPGFGPDKQNEGYLLPAAIALPSERIFKINLLPKVDREARLFPYVLVSLTLVWVACLGLLGYTYMNSRAELADKELAVQQLNDELVLLQNELINSQKPTTADPREVIDAIKQQQVDVVSILNELENRLPKQASIRSLTYAKNGELTINTVFQAMGDASRYLFDLRRMSFAQGVSMSSVTKEETVEETEPAVTTDTATEIITDPVTGEITVPVETPTPTPTEVKTEIAYKASYSVTMKTVEEEETTDGAVE
ncbi:type IV pilus assembly protein PilM [Paenibacillus phyllosphaerae]|uniref:Type IV pilus assembly protein PilM n=1 Tax=Paenibacillus phyllosphaerae TaxID=274593 RepID=A0A7W5AU53_9BACL|nr:pilus assembly protein PilM [Paenibacillus phyllosphaerae]MBB3108727.1 type IV pilus assembly protein PilM [Paenibacillus phyllosphaerae]